MAELSSITINGNTSVVPAGGGGGGVSQAYVDNADQILQNQIDAIQSEEILYTGYVQLLSSAVTVNANSETADLRMSLNAYNDEPVGSYVPVFIAPRTVSRQLTVSRIRIEHDTDGDVEPGEQKTWYVVFRLANNTSSAVSTSSLYANILYVKDTLIFGYGA